MRVGCDLPYFADPGETRAFAAAAEELGFHHLGFAEHVAASRTTAFPAGFSFDDPWHESSTMLGFLAAATDSIELVTAMHLATLRHPVLVAKQAAEADLLSGGRLRLGVSVGWNREEQRALSQDPATRAGRLEEAVPLLRRLWSDDAVTHDGRYFHLDAVGIHPRPGRVIPIWMGAGALGGGGRPTAAALRRAARLADGFTLMAPTGLDVGGALRIIQHLHDLAVRAGRTIAIEARLLTQVTPPDEWAAVLRRYRHSGLVSHVGLGNRVAGGGVDAQIAHVREVVERTRDEW